MINWQTRVREASSEAQHVLDDDIIEELATHARSAYEAARADGSSLPAAEAHVLRLIQSWMKEAPKLGRRPRRAPMIDPPGHTSSRLQGLANDFRYGLRVLAHQRLFAILAIMTMALAIGVMTTLFSVAYGVLLKPLPWPEPDRLIRLTESHEGATRQMPLTMSNIGYNTWLDHPGTIEAIGAWSRTSATITGSGDAERLSVATVTAGTFPLLRAIPLLGTAFTNDDDLKIVLSYALWQQRYGGSASVLGQLIPLDGKPYTVVAVMPRDFAFPDQRTRAWIPLSVPPVVSKDGKSLSVSTFSAMARLRPGVTPQQASAEATARARGGPDAGSAAMALFGSRGAATVSAVPALEAITQDVRPALISLLVAVTLLLITAIANVASLQLARATTRHREMAIRSAIGAGTSRLIQQLLAESMILAIAGGIAGLALTMALHAVLPSMLPADFPRSDNVALNSIVLAFSVAITLATGFLLGLLPAWHLRRLRLVEALTENTAGSIGGNRTRSRTVIMVGQVAIACTLLIGAVLLTRSFVAMMDKDRGFDPGNTLTAQLIMPSYAFDPQRRVQLMDAFLERASRLPNLTHAALTTGLPLTNSENLSGFHMPSLRPPLGVSVDVHAVRSVINPDYFAALGMRVVQGRGFQNSDDSAAAPRVLIVNRTFARQYLSDAAVGDRFANFMNDDGTPYEVIGVVDDVVKRSLSEAPQPEIFTLIHQSAAPKFQSQYIVLGTSGDPRALIEPLKSLIREQDSSATLDSIMTMEDRISTSLARPRLYAVLLGTFALSALAIASVGLFGVLSYTVAQRTREFAVRTALGARPAQVVRLVLRQGLVVTIMGLAIGVGVSFAAVSYLATLLYGVSSHDWLSFAAVVITITLIAVVACIVPAFRAMKIDPIRALRAS